MSISKLHETARAFAESGIPVFPCVPNGKAPATEHGYKDASANVAQIDAWWTENPDYNLALSPEAAGWCVIDIDGPDGEQAWRQRAITPDTYEVMTPRGGRHLYFTGSLPSTVKKLFPAEPIDTRGVGGYVLVPPSVVNGKPYEVLHDRDIQPAPNWIAAKLGAARDRVAAAIEDLDLAGNVDRAKRLLASLVDRGDVAISGRGGNDRTYRLSCEVLNLGLSAERTGELLADIWNPHCIPPWSQDELGAIVANAASYAQNEAGAWAVAPAADIYGSALDSLPDSVKTQPERRSRFHFENEAEQEEGKDAPFLIDRLIPDATTVLIVGAKGSFKTFIAQDILLSLAAGVDCFGVKPSRSGPVFFGAHEGRNEMKRARRRAWKIAREIIEPVPFFIAPGPRIASVEECEEFREQIRVQLRKGSTRIAAIALDTVAKCLAGLDENSAADVGQFVAFCDSLVAEFECPVIALHHTGKNGLKTSRGSGALEAGFGTVIDVERAGKTKAVAVSVRYHKDAEEPEKPWTFEGHVVGPSLVFTPISGAEYQAQVKENDPFERTKIGAVLQKLGAVGRENAVSTLILAGELTPTVENEAPEARSAAVTKSQRILSSLSSRSLEAYCAKEGRDLWWWLPDATTE